MVIDDGMHECISELRIAIDVARLVLRRGAVLLALVATDVTPAATVGNVAELLHVYVHHRSRVIMLVAADGLTCFAVDMRESVQAGGTAARIGDI